eukprot:gene1824-8685_t
MQTRIATVARDAAAMRAHDAEEVTRLRSESLRHSLDAATAVRERGINYHDSVATRASIKAAGNHDELSARRGGWPGNRLRRPRVEDASSDGDDIGPAPSDDAGIGANF